eukprot:gnl/TRDRNA2_/TRDRNA2_45120_c0_seq1.p1 gnl/TRDRNA2_/TRDRNA2_45120_c0~~gnl/TRDRNA2_/TRDRNA2_45120_c0_seq1.p1  ORF type:complete len:549 (+),score=114.67 gnl/TRDRNA2_/TRDRNA2_45120_c0_seq1:80-1648(+)
MDAGDLSSAAALAEEPAPASPKSPGGSRRAAEDPLEKKTWECIDVILNAEMLPTAKELTSIVDENAAACEAVLKREAPQRSVVERLLRAARDEAKPQRAANEAPSGYGFVSDMFSSWGFGGILPTAKEAEAVLAPVSSALVAATPVNLKEEFQRPWQAIQAVIKSENPMQAVMELGSEAPKADTGAGGPSCSYDQAVSSKQEELTAAQAEFNGAFERLDASLSGSIEAAVSFLNGLSEMRAGLEKLRSCWQPIRRAIREADEEDAPLETADLVGSLRQSILLRRDLSAQLGRTDELCCLIEDTVDQSIQAREERKKWRNLCRALVEDVEIDVAARISSVVWLRRKRAADALQLDASSDQVLEGALLALQQGTATALDMERRLADCASLVMRAPQPDGIRQAVGRLSMLQRTLHVANQRADSASKGLNKALELPSSPLNGISSKAEAALLDLSVAIERAKEAVDSCPLKEPESGDAVFSLELDESATLAFKSWVQSLVVAEQRDAAARAGGATGTGGAAGTVR